MLRDYAQRVPFSGCQLSLRSEQLGSNSEVDGFRLQLWDGLLVERVHPVQAFQLFDLWALSFSIGGTHTNIDSVFGA